MNRKPQWNERKPSPETTGPLVFNRIVHDLTRLDTRSNRDRRYKVDYYVAEYLADTDQPPTQNVYRVSLELPRGYRLGGDAQDSFCKPRSPYCIASTMYILGTAKSTLDVMRTFNALLEQEGLAYKVGPRRR